MDHGQIVIISQTVMIISLCALLVEIFLIYIIYNNLTQTKQQFIKLNRPWLYLHIKLVKERDPSAGFGKNLFQYFPLILENSGNLTASNIKITQLKYLNFNAKINKPDLFNTQEFYPRQTKILINSVADFSEDTSHIIEYTLSYEFFNKKIIKNYYLSQEFNSPPTLTDIFPQKT